MTVDFTRAADVILQGHHDRAYPAAVVEVGHAAGIVWRQAFGRLDYEPDSPATQDDTIFDLASLTKVVATAPSVMVLVERGKVRLGDPVARYIPEFAAMGKRNITVEQLMTHRSVSSTTWTSYSSKRSAPAFRPAISCAC